MDQYSRGHVLLRTGVHGALVRGVHVLEVDVDAAGGSLHGGGGLDVMPRPLLADHDDGVTDLDLGVHHAAAGPGETQDLLRPERLGLELDGLRRILDGHGSGDGMKSLGSMGYVGHG